jgi:hypothetical protein
VAEQDRQYRTGKTGQNGQKRTGITGKAELDSKTEQAKRNIQNGTDKTRQAE